MGYDHSQSITAPDDYTAAMPTHDEHVQTADDLHPAALSTAAADCTPPQQ
jgi:hypothetical protein